MANNSQETKCTWTVFSQDPILFNAKESEIKSERWMWYGICSGSLCVITRPPALLGCWRSCWCQIWRDLQLDSFHTLSPCRVTHPIVMNVATLSVWKTGRRGAAAQELVFFSIFEIPSKNHLLKQYITCFWLVLDNQIKPIILICLTDIIDEILSYNYLQPSSMRLKS